MSADLGDQHVEADGHRRMIVYSDGACKPNPGLMAIGASIQNEVGEEIAIISEAMGYGTSNMAEYHAAIAGVKEAKRLGARRVELRTDSQLLERQINGDYEVKDYELEVLHAELMHLLQSFASYSVKHLRRRYNRRAHALAELGYAA
jgi:ribonuclease HI